MTRWLWLVGTGMVVGTACNAEERDLARLLGPDAAVETEDEATDDPTDTDEPTDAEPTDTDDEPTDTDDVPDASMPVDVSTDNGPAPDEDAGETETDADVTEPTEETDPTETETDPEETDADAGDGGRESCSPVSSTEATCDDSVDDDCDGRVDCDDADCGDAPACCVSAGDSETLCDNANDDDCDGRRDCEDDDCALDISCLPACVPVMANEGNCGDGEDDDCDERVDCADEDCATASECAPDCVEVSSTEGGCSDDVDDDCDGFVDCDDSDCAASSDCQTACVPIPEDCTDTADNDCDGYADCLDSVCAPTAACCTASGGEICTDGVDNNCDGVIDCPVITATIPAMPPPGRAEFEGGAAAADAVRLMLETPALANFVVQCRSAKPANISAQSFVVCNPSNPSSLAVAPFGAAAASNPALNGVMETQVRFAYPNGQVSQPAAHTYYVHNSLAGAQPCPEKATDDQYFGAAEPYLVSDGAAGFVDEDAHLKSPFVNISFTPDIASQFQVGAGEGDVEYLSLRRRFSMNATKTMILMKRVYWSRRAGSRRCLTAMIRKHDSDAGPVTSRNPNRYFRNGCDAVVMNKEGAGMCLIVDAEGLVRPATIPSDAWQYWNIDIYGWLNWPQADNFMYRKLLRRQLDGSQRVFSPKCYMGGESCTGGDEHVLYLPDRGLFGL